MLPSSIKTFLKSQLLTGRNAKAFRKKLAVFAALCAGIAVLDVLLAVLFVSPAAARLESARAATADLRRRNADAVLFQKQKKAFSGMSAGIPSQQDIPIVIRDIVQTAKRLNLSVGAVNSDIPAPGSEGMAQLSFTVPLTGSYPDVKRFIHGMETTDRLLGIQAVSLKSEKGRVNMSMKLVTYIKGE